MKKTTVKKLLAALLSVAMLLCVFAGCSNEPATQTTPTDQSVEVTDTIPVGMLVLSTEASVKINYDADGMALDVTGMNDHGIVLADSYTDYMGKSCVDVVKELIAAAHDAGNLSTAVKNIVIKLAVGSTQPGSHFLESLEAAAKEAAEAAGSSAVITAIDTTMLDEDGYITLDTAKALLMNELGVTALDAYYGSDIVSNDCYICTVEVGGIESSHSIDAVTGLISDATEEDLLGDSEYIEETEYIEYDPEIDYIEEDTQPEIEPDIDIPVEEPTETQG